MKPARVQVDPSELDEEYQPKQAGNVFNIWYYNWGDKDRRQVKSKYRVNIKKDSGYTKANKVANSYICLFFARGCCHKGKECEYLHRLPSKTDNFPGSVDCFGRDKFSDYRDDMGGVGNLLQQNKTLYVGQLPVDGVGADASVEDLVTRHFMEFGAIERLRIIHSKNCVFVTFQNEWNAQFAKEALSHQSIIGDECLNIRWANEDPNPKAKARNQRQFEQDTIERVKLILAGEDEKKKRGEFKKDEKKKKKNKDEMKKDEIKKDENKEKNKRKRSEQENEESKKPKTENGIGGLISGYASSSDEE